MSVLRRRIQTRTQLVSATTARPSLARFTRPDSVAKPAVLLRQRRLQAKNLYGATARSGGISFAPHQPIGTDAADDRLVLRG